MKDKIDHQHLFICILFYGILVTKECNGADVTEYTSVQMALPWSVIVAYVCFALGGLLVLIGFARISWFACVVRSDKKKKSLYNKNAQLFTSQSNIYNNDPWMKENSLINSRIAASAREKDTLRDVDIRKFNGLRNPEFYGDEGSLTESQILDGSPRSDATENNVEHVYHSLPRHGIIHGREVRIDSDTLQRNANYEEPNTNLVLAQKNKPPTSLALDELLAEAEKSRTEEQEDLNQKQDTESSNVEAISPRSFVDTTEAFTALDNATAGEDVVLTARSDVSEGIHGDEYVRGHPDLSRGSSTPTAMSVISSKYLLDEEPLPDHREMEYQYESTSTRM